MATTKNETQTNEVKDFSKQLTLEDVQEQARLYIEKTTTNEVKIAGVVRGKNKSEPKPKIDKKTNEQVINSDGSPAFWSPYYYVTLAFEGGEIDINVELDTFEALDMGVRVLFYGVKGLRFGKIDDIFYKFEIL